MSKKDFGFDYENYTIRRSFITAAGSPRQGVAVAVIRHKRTGKKGVAVRVSHYHDDPDFFYITAADAINLASVIQGAAAIAAPELGL